MAQQIVIANDLRSGAVVYLTKDGRWSPSPDTAALADSDGSAAALLARAERDVESCLVVGAELIDVEAGGDHIQPVRLREVIRAKGPTVRTDLGYQAELEG